MTDKQPTQEQIKEFWKWCGWQIVPSGGVASPEQLVSHEPFIAGNFPKLNLNNLFKYAVPKLSFWMLDNQSKSDGTPYHAVAGANEIRRQVWSNTPALALFWAIWEAIHHEN